MLFLTDMTFQRAAGWSCWMNLVFKIPFTFLLIYILKCMIIYTFLSVCFIHRFLLYIVEMCI